MGIRFTFEGHLPSSKSLMNRYLIAQSYENEIQIEGSSTCDDVIKMKEGLCSLFLGKEIDCGHAGTVLRFLALRASRIPGQHVLKGSQRLFERPQREMVEILKSLSVNIEFLNNHLRIIGKGWQDPQKPLMIEQSQSSQFLSALILNAWDLPFHLYIKKSPHQVSKGYLRLTLNLVKHLGMKLDECSDSIFISQNQKILKNKYRVELDISSSFVVAVLAHLSGRAIIKDFPFQSEQPDIAFLNIFSQMGVQWEKKENDLIINQSSSSKAIEVSLSSCPDLFPVLSVLCALSKGVSHLYGAAHLKYKESNRLEETSKLLSIMRCTHSVQNDGILIEGPTPIFQDWPMLYSPQEDHRMAMAGMVSRVAGFPIQVSKPEVVYKSFPEFLEILRGWL